MTTTLNTLRAALKTINSEIRVSTAQFGAFKVTYHFLTKDEMFAVCATCQAAGFEILEKGITNVTRHDWDKVLLVGPESARGYNQIER